MPLDLVVAYTACPLRSVALSASTECLIFVSRLVPELFCEVVRVGDGTANYSAEGCILPWAGRVSLDLVQRREMSV